MFKFPLFREFVMAGGVCDVSKESINNICGNGHGNAAVIIVGGAAESLEARPGAHHLKLKNRKGFVKVALQNGASLVPIYTFGENELFEQLDNSKGSLLRNIQTKFQSILSFAPPLFYGRGLLPNTFGFLPHKVPLITVVGAPIIVKKAVPNPSQKEIATLHRKYVQGLITLFHQHKHRYGIPKATKLMIE
ncbi:hypothetical protein QZH41_019545 [Actinostola sp. cb2023]|nr:hypothetical protein QZH41_019545 [Actinostola sp. cb2023]